MNRTGLRALMVIAVTLAGGCSQTGGTDGNNENGGDDPSTSTAALAGTWLLEAVNGDMQCWEFDDMGAPMRVTAMGADGFQSIGLPQLDELVFDGQARDVDLEGLDATVVSTGTSAVDEDQVTVMTSSVLGLGPVETTTTLDLMGTVDEDTFTGEMTSTTSALGSTTDPLTTEFTATRDGC